MERWEWLSYTVVIQDNNTGDCTVHILKKESGEEGAIRGSGQTEEQEQEQDDKESSGDEVDRQKNKKSNSKTIRKAAEPDS